MADTAKRTTDPKPESQVTKRPTRKPARYYSESESDLSEGENPRRRRPQKGGAKNDLVPLGGLDSVTNTATGLTQSAGETLRGVTGSALSNEKKGGDKSDTLRLRLDLNLDVEITLKARIHGDLELALLLEERAIELRKETSDEPWPPKDRSVGVVLVAHSMGGFVAADTLFSILDDMPATNESAEQEQRLIFPLIQGVLSFDTPYNGLARSMFVYGAFSQYQKVSSIWNIMSAVSAGIAGGSAAVSASRTSNALAKPAQSGPSKTAWKLWQTIAVRSGTAGAIAAGGVAAYMNREKIKKSIASFDKDTLGQGYNTLGQGLAYINQESLGRGFAWISSHLKFVSALMRQEEMKQRLLRLGALEGVGLANMYSSLGENGTWTGGYFVPERTFCAVPSADEKAGKFFFREVNTATDDEINAHSSMFRPEKNDGYTKLVNDARDKVISWFKDDTRLVDPLRRTTDQPEQETPQTDNYSDVENLSEVEDSVLANADLSPVDLAAMAAEIPLPEDDAVSTGYQGYLARISAKLSQANPFNRSGAPNANLKMPSKPPLDPEAGEEVETADKPKNGDMAVAEPVDAECQEPKEDDGGVEAEKENGVVNGGALSFGDGKQGAEEGEPGAG